MCGIFGYAGIDEQPGLLERMGTLQIHRGPDDVGYFKDPRLQIQFGLRRLSIIDIEGGHQPISNESGTIWAVCNGEIYNYIELRKQLQNRGHRFKTASDVEVLVHLYEERGLDFLSDTNGMFGLALLDQTENRLILARDRLGIKPVYYSWDGKRLAFASEIKPLLLCPWNSRDPDLRAISSYLDMLYIPAPQTGFKCVRKLPSGSVGILKDNNFSIRTYWRMETFMHGARPKANFKNTASRLDDALNRACRIQLRSDVPVGAFLSGGIDSSAVVAMACQNGADSLDTYTIKWSHAPEKIDETVFAKEVADRYGCRYQEISISWNDFNRLLPSLVWHLEEPNADGAYVPTYVISRFASKQSKVILTGAGGDELFGGYPLYRTNRSSVEMLKIKMLSVLAGCRRDFFAKRAFKYPWGLIINGYTGDTEHGLMKTYDTVRRTDRMSSEMAFDMKVYLQDNILSIVDKMSMAASIEARVPLLDHQIVEEVLGIPSGFKIYGNENKFIFKYTLKDRVPHSVLFRQKDGFGAPISSWMRGPFRILTEKILKGGLLLRYGFLKPQAFTRLHHLTAARPYWSWAYWILLNLELWFRFVVEQRQRPTGIALSKI